MKHSNTLNNTFSIVIGAFLLVEGVWGLFSEMVFGVFSTNTTHAVIHIVLGIVGIVAGIKQNAGAYCTFLGILLILVGIFRFIPGADAFLITTLNVNGPVAWLNIIVGLLSLLVVSYRRPAELRN